MPVPVQAKWALVILLVLVVLYLVHGSLSSEGFVGFRGGSGSPFDAAYFDYNGTTPMYPEAEKVWRQTLRLGNAHSAYASKAREAIDSAEQTLLQAVGVDPNTDRGVIWTSGGSESNNLILRGFAITDPQSATKPHYILSAVEHKTSLECAQQLADEGAIELTVLPVMSSTFVCPYTLRDAIRPNTRLISIMHINNESGTMNNLESYARVIREVSKPYDARDGSGILLHTDAVQSMGKTPPNMLSSGLDAISFSAHKFGGPLGCGGLIISTDAAKRLQSQICGSQNHGLRGGTDNTPGIAATGKALEISLQNRSTKNGKLLKQKMRIIDGLSRAFPLGDVSQYLSKPDTTELLMPSPNASGDIRFQLVPLGNQDLSRAAPNTLWFSVVRVGPMERHFCNLRLRDDLANVGVIVSTGSACNQTTDGRMMESHVLGAIKAPYVIRCGVVRVSFGDATSSDDCDKLVSEMVRCIKLQA